MGEPMSIAALRAEQARRGLQDVHLVHLTGSGFTIAHTDAERSSGVPLTDCGLHLWLGGLLGPPAVTVPGIYRASATDAEQWSFEPIDVPSVVDVLRRARFRFSNEDELQRGVAEALAAAGFTVEREIRLNARDRIDHLVHRVGIECKVASPADSVLRQLQRYAEHPDLDELVLVTNRSSHLDLAGDLTTRRGKTVPVEVVWIGTQAL